MSKRGMVSLLFAVGVLAPAAAHHIPVFPNGEMETDNFTRLFAQIGSFEPYVELLGRTELSPAPITFGYRSVFAGAYFRVIPNLKLGLFYRGQAGAVHNNDWIAVPTAFGWEWQDTTSRYENEIIADASPRFILAAIDRNLVFMLKNRFEYNFSFGEATGYIRPELTYFIMKDRNPVAEVSVAYALELALNYGESLVRSESPYFQVLVHLLPGLQLVTGFSVWNNFWSTSADVIATSPDRYVKKETRLRIQTGIVYTLQL